jgi:hypothetical protein
MWLYPLDPLARSECPVLNGADGLFGPVDEVRIQRVADVMQRFLGGPRFNVAGMVGNPGS